MLALRKYLWVVCNYDSDLGVPDQSKLNCGGADFSEPINTPAPHAWGTLSVVAEGVQPNSATPHVL